MTARHRLFALFGLVLLLAACQDRPPAMTALPDTAATPPEAPAATDPNAPAPPVEESVIGTLPVGGAPTISDSQDFEALSARVTAEEDAARLKALRERGLEVVKPEPLPPRPKTAANVVEYALKTTNRVGEVLYKRTNPMRDVLSKRACRKYKLPDDAQEAFLALGGPERDPRHLDPDGDGFACDWDPEVYRRLVN